MLASTAMKEAPEASTGTPVPIGLRTAGSTSGPKTPTAESWSQLINIAGRQRMLSQRIVLLTLLAARHDEEARAAASAAREALALFAGSHATLSKGREGEIPGPCTADLQQAFFGPEGADQPVREFIALAERVLRTVTTPGAPRSTGLDELIARATPMLALLNRLTLSYESAARQDAKQQQLRQQALMESIQRIASEAKVVSMNARIVAARAGQEGREFSVVASVLSDISAQIENLSRLALSAR